MWRCCSLVWRCPWCRGVPSVEVLAGVEVSLVWRCCSLVWRCSTFVTEPLRVSGLQSLFPWPSCPSVSTWELTVGAPPASELVSPEGDSCPARSVFSWDPRLLEKTDRFSVLKGKACSSGSGPGRIGQNCVGTQRSGLQHGGSCPGFTPQDKLQPHAACALLLCPTPWRAVN